MTGFLVRRLRQTAIVLLGATIVVFVLLRIVPGDPVDLMLGDDAGTQEERARIIESFGLDRPLPLQYLSFIGGILRGDLGQSFRQQSSVGSLVAQAFPLTVELAVASLIIAVLVAVPIGVLAGMRQGSFWDRGGTSIALFGVSMPTFWQGIMLILIFAVWIPIFPTSGAMSVGVVLERITGFRTIDSILTGNWEALWSYLRHLTLPAVTLGTTSAAMFMRLLRTGVVEVKQQDFVEALKARGLRGRQVTRHILRNSLPVTVVVFGMQLGRLLGGTLVVEVVFGWPGLGWLMIRGIGLRDFPVVQGTVLVATLMVVLANLGADVVQGWLDPRVRADRRVRS